MNVIKIVLESNEAYTIGTADSVQIKLRHQRVVLSILWGNRGPGPQQHGLRGLANRCSDVRQSSPRRSLRLPALDARQHGKSDDERRLQSAVHHFDGSQKNRIPTIFDFLQHLRNSSVERKRFILRQVQNASRAGLHRAKQKIMRQPFPWFDGRVRTLVLAITLASLPTASTLTNAATPGHDDPPFAANGALTLEPTQTLAPLRLAGRVRCPVSSSVRAMDDGYDGRISDSFAADSFHDTAPTQPAAEAFTLPTHTAVNPETLTAQAASGPADAACTNMPTVRLIVAPASARNPAPAMFDPEGIAWTAEGMNFIGADAVMPSASQSPNASGALFLFDADEASGLAMPANTAHLAGGRNTASAMLLTPGTVAAVPTAATESLFPHDMHRMAASASPQPGAI